MQTHITTVNKQVDTEGQICESSADFESVPGGVFNILNF